MPNATRSGTFNIGGDIAIHRLGFGAMRITGTGIWGEPQDRAETLRTLKRLPDVGVNFVDTADSYGPDVSERLIREALHPYTGMLIATKGGLERPGPDVWTPNGRPEYLLQQASQELRKPGRRDRSACGSCTGSIQRCRPTSSSAPSRQC